MRYKKICLFAVFAFAAIAASTQAEGSMITSNWSNYLVPLPQELAVAREVELVPDQVGLAVAADASAMVTNAVDELRAAYKMQCGRDPVDTAFVIHIGRLDGQGRLNGLLLDGVDRLRQVPYPDQAYLVRPVGSNALAVAGLTDKGVFYGVQTLRQLLTAKSTAKKAVIPLAVITDWPDMDQRGVWNTSVKTPGFIPWMASLKLNFSHLPTGLILKKDVPAACPPLPMDLIRAAAECAFLLMPHMPHYDYLYRYGAAELYPELIGKGDGARNPCYKWGGSFAKARCPCVATPLLKRIVTEWVESAAAQGASEISLWLSERVPCQCECEECLKDGPRQFQRETKASVDAIMAARIKYPDLKGRIFFTLAGGDGGIKVSEECLALLPPEIKAEKVYSANAAFDKYAADGNWLATYNGPRVGPGYWTLRYEVDAIKKSIDKYYNAKYSALYCLSRGASLATPGKAGNWEREFGNFHYSALAEWTWNNQGRDIGQFAEAWATINGFAAPGEFGKWIEIMTPVEVYLRGATLGGINAWLQAADKLKIKGLPPVWIADLPAPERMRQMLEACDQAMPLGDQTGNQSVAQETRYARQFLQVTTSFRELYNAISDENLTNPARVQKLNENVKKFDAKIAELDRLYADIIMSAEVDYDDGPKCCAERHAQWVGQLREKVKLMVLQE